MSALAAEQFKTIRTFFWSAGLCHFFQFTAAAQDAVQ